MKTNARTNTVTIPQQFIEDHPHYHYAQEALDAIARRFPQGAFNQIENTRNLGLTKQAILRDMLLYKEFIAELDKLRRPSVLMDKTKLLLLGNCELFVDYAIGFLGKNHPSSTKLFECMYLNSHTTLVIGRAPNSSPKTISTWGNAIICDLWSKQIYSSEQFREKQKNEPPIPYYNHIQYTLSTGQTIQDLSQGEHHYLEGEPGIETHPVNRLIDQACAAWVKEELCHREVRAASITQSIFQTDPNTLNANNKKIVLDSLNKLSGIGQWKANIKSGNTWLEDFTDVVEAAQVSEILRLTGAIAEVKQTRTAIGNKPIIICNGINCLKLIEQAASKVQYNLLQGTVSCNNHNYSSTGT